MTEEIRYIANLQRQEEFDNEVTELKGELKRLEQENQELKKQLSSTKCHLCGEGFLTPEGAELYEEKNNYRSALKEINRTLLGVRGLSINCDRQIGKVKAIINEVLGEK